MDGLAPGQRCEVLIQDIGRDGQGIGRCGEAVVFVPGALPGERVQACLVHRARRHWIARLETLEQSSPERRRPPCILASACGGCSLQHLDPRAQLAWKHAAVTSALQRIAGLEPAVDPVLPAGTPLGYRNRAIIPLERGLDGRVRCGFYQRGSHRIVNMNHCPVLDPRLDALVEPLKADLSHSDWPIDRHGRQGGGLRHLALRIGAGSGEILITLISSHGHLPGLERLAQRWMQRWAPLVGVTLNLQPLPSNLLMGPETRVVAGRGWLRERFAGHELQISSDSFFQIFTHQAERVVGLLNQVLAQHPRPGLALDAYCGIGTYSLPLAAAGWQVRGVELHPGAVRLARRNAAANGLAQHCDFHSGDVASLLPGWLAAADLLFLDPPRRGLEPAVVEAIRSQPPACLLYLSCDPASLARDLRPLVNAGPYQLQRVQPLDFFPHTTHVETFAVLQRR